MNSISKYMLSKCEHCNGTGDFERINPIWLVGRRHVSGLSLREVARRLKLSAAYVSDVENGKRRGNPEIIEFYSALK